MQSRPFVVLVAALLSTALGTAAVLAWSPQTQISIADQAASIVPPDLVRQIDKHRRSYHEGAVAPFRGTEALDHSANDDGSGRLVAVIDREVARAIAMIVEHRPFGEIVSQLGVVSHYVADASNPLNSSAADAGEGRYFADYLGYAESARERIRASFYGFDDPADGDAFLEALLERSLDRSRRLYPVLGTEYARIPEPNGQRYFDDRSTAFAVTSLAYSNAISDAAGVLRYIWLQAGGGDARNWLPKRADPNR